MGFTSGKDKLKAVEKAKIPKSKEEIKSFVGLCSFFRSHVKDFAKLYAPLNKAKRKDSTYQNRPITIEVLEAYLKLKNILCSEPVMAYPISDRTVDASTGTAEIEGGMGAILTQIDKNEFFMPCPMLQSNSSNMRRTTPHTCWKWTLLSGQWSTTKNTLEGEDSLSTLTTNLWNQW